MWNEPSDAPAPRPALGDASPSTGEPGGSLTLDAETRRTIWARTGEILEAYVDEIARRPVASPATPAQVRALLASCTFDDPMPARQALEWTAAAMLGSHVHAAHPRYFGMFTPAPAAMSVVADALVAGFNPQLAGWTHSPFAVEVERHLIAMLAARIGWAAADVEGTLATGGSEANYTAIVSALTSACPAFADGGLCGLTARPVLYASTDVHDSALKGARLCGLGAGALRRVPIDARRRMNPDALASQIDSDRRHGFAPFLVIATAGTTAAGAIDPLDSIAAVAHDRDLWLHVDAAWGGAAALVPQLRGLLRGLTLADSITIDAHKWLAVPMGAGIYLSRRRGVLGRTFGVDAHAYAPQAAEGPDVADPYLHSLQWSRRFAGLKLFMSLLVAGWRGYEQAIVHQVTLGDHLRSLLVASDWRVVNDTPLPLVCFVDGRPGAPRQSAYIKEIARAVVESGEAWLSTVTLGGGPEGTACLRACITNHRTAPSDVQRLVRALDAARDRVVAGFVPFDPEESPCLPLSPLMISS